MIHTSLSPNTEQDDIVLALKTLLSPWKWKNGKAIQQLESAFAEKLGVHHAISFQRGRDALYVLLQALDIGKGDEVLLQAYTCIVVPNAILYTGAKPVYVDLEKKGFNIDPESIEKSISKRTKAVIVQHTFGEPADLKKIQEICKKNGIILIEDCAHALSGTYEGKPLGTFGKAAIWSFGRDKIISSVWGGMITSKDEDLAKKIHQLHEKLARPSFFQIFQALMHPLVFSLIKPIYKWKIGRIVLAFFQKTQCIPKVIFPAEKKGKRPHVIPQRMANAMSLLALHQFKKLDRFHRHRTSRAAQYEKGLMEEKSIRLPQVRTYAEPAWLRYTIRLSNAQKIIRRAREKDLYLGDWYTSVLAPGGCNLKDFQYQEGSCPRAEKASRETINLPTHIQVTSGHVDEIIHFLHEAMKSEKVSKEA